MSTTQGSQAQSGAATDNTNAAGSLRIIGCLRQNNGNYVITDPTTGTSYSLFGQSDLGTHVGQEVEIMGLPTGTSQNTASSPSQNQTVGQQASENPFMVRSIKQMGECSNTGGK
jgi:hypothetical protein